MSSIAKGLQAVGNLRSRVTAVWASIALRIRGVVVGQNVRLYGCPVIARCASSIITLGDRVVLCSDPRYTALGTNHAVVLRTLGAGAEIVIGNDVGISGGTICAVKRVSIGDGTMLGANVTIMDTDFHPISSASRRYDDAGIESSPVEIGANVFIGASVIILKGVRIGDNSVIGAGSVVSGDIPVNAIAAGNPCRVIKVLSGDGE
jgi:acetyltransferase-like isoleucine patch superfamily enzyme